MFSVVKNPRQEIYAQVSFLASGNDKQGALVWLSHQTQEARASSVQSFDLRKFASLSLMQLLFTNGPGYIVCVALFIQSLLTGGGILGLVGCFYRLLLANDFLELKIKH